MDQKPVSVVEIFQQIDQLIEANDQSDDPDVRKLVSNLKRLRRKTSRFGDRVSPWRLLWIADRLKEYLDDQDWFSD